MSRRRSPRDLPDLADVTVGVTVVTTTSSGMPVPCPGRCNRVWRSRAERADQHTWATLSRLITQRATAEDIEVTMAHLEQTSRVGDPVPGDPVWCPACEAQIVQAAATWWPRVEIVLDTATPTAGEFLKPAADGSRRDDGASQVTGVTPIADGRLVEHLDCGHNNTRLLGPIGPIVDSTPPAQRHCRTCLVSVRTPSPGGLAPRPGAQGQRRSTRLTSPSLSPAWVEVDAALAWVCTTARTVQGALGQAEQAYPWKTGETGRRLDAGRRAADYLTHWLPEVLALRGQRAFLVELGRNAMAAGAQLQRLSGEEVTEQSLPTPCPSCDMRALRRSNGTDLVWCAYCHTRLDRIAYAHAVSDAVYDHTTEGAHP